MRLVTIIQLPRSIMVDSRSSSEDDPEEQSGAGMPSSPLTGSPSLPPTNTFVNKDKDCPESSFAGAGESVEQDDEKLSELMLKAHSLFEGFDKDTAVGEPGQDNYEALRQLIFEAESLLEGYIEGHRTGESAQDNCEELLSLMFKAWSLLEGFGKNQKSSHAEMREHVQEDDEKILLPLPDLDLSTCTESLGSNFAGVAEFGQDDDEELSQLWLFTQQGLEGSDEDKDCPESTFTGAGESVEQDDEKLSELMLKARSVLEGFGKNQKSESSHAEMREHVQEDDEKILLPVPDFDLRCLRSNFAGVAEFGQDVDEELSQLRLFTQQGLEGSDEDKDCPESTFTGARESCQDDSEEQSLFEGCDKNIDGVDDDEMLLPCPCVTEQLLDANTRIFRSSSSDDYLEEQSGRDSSRSPSAVLASLKTSLPVLPMVLDEGSAGEFRQDDEEVLIPGPCVTANAPDAGIGIFRSARSDDIQEESGQDDDEILAPYDVPDTRMVIHGGFGLEDSLEEQFGRVMPRSPSPVPILLPLLDTFLDEDNEMLVPRVTDELQDSPDSNLVILRGWSLDGDLQEW